MRVRCHITFALIAVLASCAVGYFVTAALQGGAKSLRQSVVELPTADPWPIGQIAFSPSGNLYFVNQSNGDIDELERQQVRTILAVPHPEFYPIDKSIVGTEGLAVTADAIWFTSNGLLYRASRDGSHIERVPASPGAELLEMLQGGTLLYSTSAQQSSGIFERLPNGTTRRVAGGGDVYEAALQATPQSATDEGLGEASGIAGVSSRDFYFTYNNRLYSVRGEIASVLTAPNLRNFFNGEMAAGPDNVIDAICGWWMCQVHNGLVTELFKLPTQVDGSFVGPSGIAISPKGVVYESYTASATSPISAERGGIIRISSTGRPTIVLAAKY
jgi:hypothetical protein